MLGTHVSDRLRSQIANRKFCKRESRIGIVVLHVLIANRDVGLVVWGVPYQVRSGFGGLKVVIEFLSFDNFLLSAKNHLFQVLFCVNHMRLASRNRDVLRFD